MAQSPSTNFTATVVVPRGAEFVSAEPNASQPGATKKAGSSFWTSLPGLLTAISGFLTAIVAVCAFLYQIAGSDKGDDPKSANDVAGSSSHANTATQAAPNSSAAVNTDQPLWHDKLLFSSSGVDFDVVPPDISARSAYDFYDAGSHQIAPVGSTAILAKWAGAGTPTATDCANLLAREGLSKTQTYFQGAKFCLRSKETHMIVFVTFVGPKSDEYEIDVTVWAPRD
jgi:hypothetical protein